MVDLTRGTPGDELLNRGFRRAHRLRSAAEFSQVLSVRRVLRGEFFDLHYLSLALPAGVARSVPRLGLVVAKKLVRRAVQRNQLKRLAREVFRLTRHDLPAYDLVLRLARPPGATMDRETRTHWRADIQQLLKRLPQ